MKEIQLNILNSSFLLILATETSWDESVKSEEIFGNNFNVFRHDRNLQLSKKKSGGGVLIAVNIVFSSEEIVTTKYMEFEQVWTKVRIRGETHIFCSVYFPPEHANKKSFEVFFQIAREIITNLEPEVKVHIYGDFNQRQADFISDNENESILLPIVGENETLQYFFEETAGIGLNQVNHVKNKQNAYLDLLFTNYVDDFCISESLTPLWKNETFHTAIEYSLFVHNYTTPNSWEYEEVPEYNKTNYELVKNILRMIEWQEIFFDEGNVDSLVHKFYSVITSIISNTVPLKKRRRNQNSKHPIWINTHLKKLKNRKQKAHKKYKTETNYTNLQNYLNICNELDTATKTAFDEYNRKMEEEIKTCPKIFFNYVKTKLKSENFPHQMHLDGNIKNDANEICTLFGHFFQEVYTTFSEDDRNRDFFEFIPEYPTDISVRRLSPQEVLGALRNLDSSKGPGPDGIPPIFLKNLATELTKPLLHIFNVSLQDGIFPEFWKRSFLLPIYKSGAKSDVRNYRGIAILSCIPKLFESIVNEKLFQQVKTRITHCQHGFFKGRSTSSNLLEFVTFTLNAMNNGNHVEALYTDFSKAFDRIDIPLLIYKLDKIGFDPWLLKWIESYLLNREQIVRFKNSQSDPIQVTSGVPQGSHLGPLLFILYVNDISFILKYIKILIYADDMKLFIEIKNTDDIKVFQNEINIFYEWCKKSLLELNVKKCMSIVFSRKHRTPISNISLGDQIITNHKTVRDLGVILDSKLTFTDHYNTIIHKANNMLGFIKRFSYNFQDPYTLKTLYITYVRPILEYCSVVWSPYQALHEQRIESVQKQFLLYALRKLNWNTLPLPPYEARLQLIHIDTLKTRRNYAQLSFVNDIVSQRVDSYVLLEKLNFRAPSRPLINRLQLFNINFYRTDYAKFQPINQMMSVHNSYCEIVDVTMTKQQLKTALHKEQIRRLNHNVF